MSDTKFQESRVCGAAMCANIVREGGSCTAQRMAPISSGQLAAQANFTRRGISVHSIVW